MKPPSLTIGIEEEYQIIDPKTRELKSYITQFLEEGKLMMREAVKAELHQSMIEVGTEICRTPLEAKNEIIRLRRGVMELAAKHGLKIAAAGTHPFSSWIEQEITPFERYIGVWKDMRDLAHQLLIFGTHVHIGIEDKEFMVDAMNVSRYFMPHILALSTSSPFWMGRNTGLKSFRTTVFRRFPRTGVPEQFESWSAYENFVNLLVKLNCIDNGKKIWWDVRPHPTFGTLEFRMFDVSTRVEEAVAIAALTQAIIVKLHRLYQGNMSWRLYRRALIEENKWRAARYGIEGKLIDFGKQTEKPASHLIREFLTWFLSDVLDDLGSRKEVEYAFDILENGSSADRQLATFHKTGDLKDVVDQLIRESEEGVIE